MVSMTVLIVLVPRIISRCFRQYSLACFRLRNNGGGKVEANPQFHHIRHPQHMREDIMQIARSWSGELVELEELRELRER
jgi:hypothetical protein